METEENAFKLLSDYLSNERTYLSEMRTAISFVCFGITLNRFSLYLIQENKEHERAFHFLSDGATTGLGMVVAGLLMLAWSVHRYTTVLNAIKTQKYSPPKRIYVFVSAILIGLAVLGAFRMILD